MAREKKTRKSKKEEVKKAVFLDRDGCISPDNFGIRPDPEKYHLYLYTICLLYTSDAADDLLCVDLGGSRIIKKKKHKTPQPICYLYNNKHN